MKHEWWLVIVVVACSANGGCARRFPPAATDIADAGRGEGSAEDGGSLLPIRQGEVDAAADAGVQLLDGGASGAAHDAAVIADLDGGVHDASLDSSVLEDATVPNLNQCGGTATLLCRYGLLATCKIGSPCGCQVPCTYDTTKSQVWTCETVPGDVAICPACKCGSGG